MSDPKRDPLDAALARLPREVQPSRDLWPAIEAQLSEPADEEVRASPRRRMSVGWMQLAAGVLILVATAATTYVLTRESMTKEMVATTLPQVSPTQMPAAVPTAYVSQVLGAGYLDARKQLEATYREKIAALPPGTRAKLERDLADLSRAATEVANTLEQHPSDPLLQELLMSTYQSELDLLSGVGEMTTATSVRTDL